MSTHTPGPWTWIGPYDNGAWLLTGDNGAVIHCSHPMSVSEQDRNLIAAAPELLDALKLVLSRSWDGPLPDDTREIATAAIAKATGKEGA